MGNTPLQTGWWLAVTAVVLMTVVAARFNAGLADFINTDPQGVDQVREVERFATGLVYTSGHSVGQVIAMVFGVLVAARATDAREHRRKSLTIAFWGGTGLALANLVTALLIGVLAGEWLVRSAVHNDYFNPRLLWHVGVIMMVAFGVVGFPAWAVIGAVVRHMAGVDRRGLAIVIFSPLVALALNGFVNIQLTLLMLDDAVPVV